MLLIAILSKNIRGEPDVGCRYAQSWNSMVESGVFEKYGMRGTRSELDNNT